jgi:hypothetical protein
MPSLHMLEIEVLTLMLLVAPWQAHCGHPRSVRFKRKNEKRR